jgi:DNA polymerase-3 subunit beta
MKFSVSTEHLRKAVQIVERAISARTSLPIMENMHVSVKNKQLCLRAHDLEIGVEFSVPVDTAETAEVLVKGKTLSSIVSKLTDATVQLSIDEKHRVSISSGTVEFDLRGVSVSEYPNFPGTESGQQIQLPIIELQSLIKHTAFAVSTDETKQFLNGVLVKADEGMLSFVATDGYRLSYKKSTVAITQDFQFIVPSKCINELSKILSQLPQLEAIEMNIASNQVSFRAGTLLLVSRLIQGQFPDFRQVIPSQKAVEFKLSRRPLLEALDRSLIIASEANYVVHFILSATQLGMYSQAPSMGEFKESIAIDWITGAQDIRLSFNVKLVLDAVRLLEDDDVVLGFKTPTSPTLIKPVHDDTYLYVVMPIKTEATSAPQSAPEPVAAHG